MDSQCDMFEFTDGSQDYCFFFPGVSFKNKNFNEIIKPYKTEDWGYGRNLFILHCETSQENWVENSDLYTNTQDRWEVQNECSTVKRSEHFGTQVSNTKPAGDLTGFKKKLINNHHIFENVISRIFFFKKQLMD